VAAGIEDLADVGVAQGGADAGHAQEALEVVGAGEAGGRRGLGGRGPAPLAGPGGGEGAPFSLCPLLEGVLLAGGLPDATGPGHEVVRRGWVASASGPWLGRRGEGWRWYRERRRRRGDPGVAVRGGGPGRRRRNRCERREIVWGGCPGRWHSVGCGWRGGSP